MYFPPKWPHRLRQLVEDRLKAFHHVTYYATLLTLEDVHVLRLPGLLAGSKVDNGNFVTVVVLDPGQSLAHYEGGNARQYLIRAFCEIDTEDAEFGVVAWEVATAAVDTCTRSGDGASVTFAGRNKQALAQFKPLDPVTAKAGMKVTDAIRFFMREAGEADSLMDIPDRPRTLKHDVTVAPVGSDEGKDDPTPHTFMVVARLLADELGDVLFYRPNGRLLQRQISDIPVHIFAPETIIPPGATSTGEFDIGFYNVIVGKWGKNLGEKPVVVPPPPGHKLAPRRIGRRGKDYTQALILEFPHERNRDAVEVKCRQRLRVELSRAETWTASVFPFPFLEPHDVVGIKGHGSAEVSWTLPLVTGETMTLGWNRFEFLGPL
jgi:hypothetical protein